MTTQERLNEHLNEALNYFHKDQIVGIFLQGSQNYGLDIPTSDVDTKLIVVPTLDDIVFNRKPQSTTHVRANTEHIDFKDIRLMIQTFKKQNLNFVEVLFTPFKWENELYAKQWDKLIEQREAIAHYSRYRTVKTMKGIAMEKFHAMEHEYPSKLEVLAKFGYDPKQLHHLLRIQDFLTRYIDGESYENCMRPRNLEYLKDVKRGCYNLAQARGEAVAAMLNIEETVQRYCDTHEDICNPVVGELLDDVQSNIIKIALKKELQ